MVKGTGLTEAEADFVESMRIEDEDCVHNWRHFDPDFRQGDIARLIRRRWFEKHGEGRYREYRWLPAGRAALAERGGADPSPTSPVAKDERHG